MITVKNLGLSSVSNMYDLMYNSIVCPIYRGINKKYFENTSLTIMNEHINEDKYI